MTSQKVLLYVALVVLIVQVAVSSPTGGAQPSAACKCTKFDDKGKCAETSCECPPGKTCTPKQPRARAPAAKASAASAAPSRNGARPASRSTAPKTNRPAGPRTQ